MSRRAATVGYLLVIVGLAVPMVAAGGQLAVGSGPSVSLSDGPALGGDRPAQQTPFALGSDRFDRTLFEITVYENQSARWRFQYTQRLANDSEETNFKAYAADFRENETDLYRQFVAYGDELARTGTNVTGRQMNATGFARDARMGTLDQLGIVEMSFTWTNFAQQEADGVLVSDVFEGGLAIRSEQRLRIVAGPTLTLDSVDPLPSNTSVQALAGEDSVEWVGEYSFADQRPRVAFRPTAETTTEPGVVTTSDGSETTLTDRTTNERTATTDPSDSTTASPETDATGTTAASGGAFGGLGLGGMLVGLGAITLVVVVATWRSGIFDVSERDSPATGGDANGGAGSGSQSQGGQTASTAGSEGPAVSETALLSDDDRVRQLLEDNGGRMKQTKIVEATEWSKSKVSMLLSEMEDDGEITKLRVGRENIVSLPGDEPAAAGSPFDDPDDE
ncbi:hypothetical protein [Halorhabdus sp. BNX81]|uniref:helix-turn-helix transcriptional regulator n=1 Tax=Halorhabdus sp. BNX81 TaxID=2980181 RepID=UPI0023DD5344|nr:hypothetical protein [Halorhabdus sp. BNX81]WEL22161.1 Putative membrane-associated or secreted trancriptional regulator [Halorhabdus sp. BNX81]